MLFSNTQFHIHNSNGPLITVVKVKAKENFHIAAIQTQENYLNLLLHITAGPYIKWFWYNSDPQMFMYPQCYY